MKVKFVEDYYKKCSLYFPHAQKVDQLFTQAVNWKRTLQVCYECSAFSLQVKPCSLIGETAIQLQNPPFEIQGAAGSTHKK